MRNYATDAALRPQPKRAGPDLWSTPTCLVKALAVHILPNLPPAPIWEPAAGDGVLVKAITAAGYPVVAGDLSTGQDFLSIAPPPHCGSLVTNPPFYRLDNFLNRAVGLLEAPNNQLLAAVLLLRWDALTARVRAPLLQRAYRIYVCTWRPRWIAGSTMSPRWSFCWSVWLRGHTGPPQMHWLARPSNSEFTPHSLAPERAGLVGRCEDRLAATAAVDRQV